MYAIIITMFLQLVLLLVIHQLLNESTITIEYTTNNTMININKNKDNI